MEIGFLEFISKYWSILVTIASGIYAFAHLKFQNKDQETRLIVVEREVKELRSSQNVIDVRLAQIQTDISWIREKLDKK